MFRRFYKSKSTTASGQKAEILDGFLDYDFAFTCKILFPIEYYHTLPADPRFENFDEMREYLISNLIPVEVQKDFFKSRVSRSPFMKSGIPANGSALKDSDKQELFHFWLDQQPVTTLTWEAAKKEFLPKRLRHLDARSAKNHFQRSQPLNLYLPQLDAIPHDILMALLDVMLRIFGNTAVAWQPKEDSSAGERPLKELIRNFKKTRYEMSFMDKLYDPSGKWQVFMPKSSFYVLVGFAEEQVTAELKNKGLEIEAIRAGLDQEKLKI